MRIKIVDYEGATKAFDEELNKLSIDVIPKIIGEFSGETSLPWICDVEIHKALMVKKLSDGLRIVYSSGFVYKLDKSLNILSPTIQLYAPKILTYDYRGL
ncbi:MAG: hypothetical protein QXX09_01945, partial [Candidatus Methanomethylicia archaeon]